MTLGERLYEMRKAKGLSQERVAEELEVTRQTVSKWETDQTTPDFDKIIPLCELYNITADELIKGSAESQSNNYNYDYYDSSAYDIQPREQAESKKERDEKYRKRSALLMAVAICLYILSVTPFFVLSDGRLMMTLFFVIIAVATMIVVFSQLSKPKDYKKRELQTKESKLYKLITSILSGITLVVYMLISFLTKAWHITWLMWVIYGIVCEIIKLIFSLKGVEINDEE